ncbi:hypothetical protein [Streptomyces sp. 7N604]|uniref:hypothetical protein n=1 Tax=Streptomyces sp. 7N604 TaxID=3457415 RepID=UPI003FD00861
MRLLRAVCGAAAVVVAVPLAGDPEPEWEVSVAVPASDRLGPAAHELLSYLRDPCLPGGCQAPR